MILGLLLLEAGVTAALGAILGLVLLYGGLWLARPAIDAAFGLWLPIAALGLREGLTLAIVIAAATLISLFPALRGLPFVAGRWYDRADMRPMPHLSRRHLLALSTAAAVLPRAVSAVTAREIEWLDLLPRGVPYPEIIAEGEMDIEADTWVPVYDEHARLFNNRPRGRVHSHAGLCHSIGIGRPRREGIPAGALCGRLRARAAAAGKTSWSMSRRARPGPTTISGLPSG